VTKGANAEFVFDSGVAALLSEIVQIYRWISVVIVIYFLLSRTDSFAGKHGHFNERKGLGRICVLKTCENFSK
jgi:hypothetical protein